MINKNYTIKKIDNSKIYINFVKNNHYSKTCPNGIINFGCFDKTNKLVGVGVFGQVIGRFQSNKYYPENPSKLIELRRLVFINDTLKNIESWFIGYCLRYISKNTDYEAILSLADSNQSHTGIIYKATGFKQIGYDMDKRKRIIINGIERHPRDLYDKHGTSSVPVLKEIYKENISFIDKKPKIIFLKILHKSYKVNTRQVHCRNGGSNPTLVHQVKLNKFM